MNILQQKSKADISQLMYWVQGRIQPVRVGGAISVIFGGQASLRVHYCKSTTVRIVQNHGESAPDWVFSISLWCRKSANQAWIW